MSIEFQQVLEEAQQRLNEHGAHMVYKVAVAMAEAIDSLPEIDRGVYIDHGRSYLEGLMAEFINHFPIEKKVEETDEEMLAAGGVIPGEEIKLEITEEAESGLKIMMPVESGQILTPDSEPLIVGSLSGKPLTAKDVLELAGQLGVAIPEGITEANIHANIRNLIMQIGGEPSDALIELCNNLPPNTGAGE